MKTDILNRADIETLVDSFYAKVMEDDTIGFIFNDIAKVDWSSHLPVMYNFWDNTLFYSGNYTGNIMNAHRNLNHKLTLKKEYFDHWTDLFVRTINEHFEGEMAERAKQRALSIATVLQIKIIGNTAE